MQQILIEISHQDQVFVEEECTKQGYTLSSFFLELLKQYKERQQPKKEEKKEEPKEEVNHVTSPEKASEEKEETKEEKPKRGRKKKGE